MLCNSRLVHMRSNSIRILGLSFAITSAADALKTPAYLRYVHTDAMGMKKISSGISIAEASKKGNGEDAYFILPRDVGVFDGVGGWRDSGIDSGLYSRHLAAASATAVKKQRGMTDVEVSLTKALDIGAASCKTEKLTGSSTATMASLNNRDAKLQVLNLGDSGLILFRKSGNAMQIVGQTMATTHGFNFPAQIGNIGDPRLGSMKSDTSDDATLNTFALEDGDVAVMGTDGLWDNVFEEQIMDILVKSDMLNKPEGIEVEKTDVDKVVKAITLLALDQSISRTVYTPWTVGLEAEHKRQKLFFDKAKNMGGKKDDITVILSYFHK